MRAMSNQAESPTTPQAIRKTEGGKTVLVLSGDWKLGVKPEFSGADGTAWPDSFRTEALGKFDSTLPAYLLRKLRDADIDDPPLDGLREDLRGLMELALKVPERSEAKSKDAEPHGIRWLGARSSAAWLSVASLLEFIGDTVLATLRFFTGRAGFRARDFWLTVQECGVGALPIVSLISFLIGMILAFVGNVQLASFGASLYVADLVGIAMVREMGVMMTAIIMSGRTGAAFAAHIGSMNANQEIDALKTFGFNPFDFLVLPRIFALVLMMPILTIYSNAVGILGGMLVGAGVGIPPRLFLTEMLTAVDLTQASLGVFKSVFFGAAIAIAGCLQGMKSGSSSAAVGEATTRAVVASITAIIILDSAFAVIFTILDI
jgi:phospholipid/cholesterol/gamma-HCH transport system permease protein